MSARRAATFLAALGVLVMSSGVALMLSATPANAAPDPKVVVCKYVSTPGGELQGGNNPIEVSINTLNNVVEPEWIANPTFPKAWNDAQGQGGGSIAIGYAGEGLGIEDCPSSVPDVCPEGTDHEGETIPEGETAETFCNDETPPEVCPEGTDNAGQEIPAGQTAETFCNDVVSPPEVCPEGTDNAGQEIPAGQTAAAFCDNTVIVSPPNPPKKHHTTTVTPTVVHAGLAGATVQDMRGEQGLALTFVGMLMLVAAGGLGLRMRGSAARI